MARSRVARPGRKPRAPALAKKFAAHPLRDARLRRALKKSEPGDVVAVHDLECPMTAACRCAPVRLIVGARA